MRIVRDLLRLSAAGMSKRKIAASVEVSATAALDCIGRARCAGLSRPPPEGLTDEMLGSALRAAFDGDQGSSAAAELVAVHRELRRPGISRSGSDRGSANSAPLDSRGIGTICGKSA
jgi:hypothetical protein